MQADKLLRKDKLNDEKRITPSTILITGASRGIGKAAALRFAKEGWQVIITCIHHTHLLKQVQEEIEALGASCLAFTGNMGKMEDAQELFSRIEHKFGTLDVLVNNAGISHIGLIQEMTIKEWEQIIQSNLTSVFAAASWLSLQ